MVSAVHDPIVIECESEEQWLGQRRLSIGASDSPALFGQGYEDQSRVTVWEEKVYGRTKQFSEDFLELLQVGKLLEPSLRDIFALKTGLPVEPSGTYTIRQHPDVPYVSATLDGWCLDPDFGRCPLELKNVQGFFAADWENDVPLKHQIQVQHQLAVTGCHRGYLMGFLGGNKPFIKPIDRDEKFIAALLATIASFWGYVATKELPPIDGSSATARALTRIFPNADGEIIDLHPSFAKVHEEIEQAREDEKAAKERKQLGQNKIRAAIGDRTWAQIPGVDGYYSWKESHRKEHVVKASSGRTLRKVKKIS